MSRKAAGHIQENLVAHALLVDGHARRNVAALAVLDREASKPWGIATRGRMKKKIL